MHRHLLAHHLDAERVPLADRVVGPHQGEPLVLLVVPQRSRALVVAVLELRRIVGIPDLHLRRATEIDAAVPLGLIFQSTSSSKSPYCLAVQMLSPLPSNTRIPSTACQCSRIFSSAAFCFSASSS